MKTVDAFLLPPHHRALSIIIARLADMPEAWVVTGSAGMALHGMPIDVHDIDLQTDQQGAYDIERRLVDYVALPVRFLASERIRSHLGKLQIEGVDVEVMGALQKRQDAHTWEPPVQVELYRQWLELDGARIPVLSLEYEYQAYLKLGRLEKAARILAWLTSTTHA